MMIALCVGACKPKPKPKPKKVAPKEEKHRVFIIGLDGLDWNRLNAMFEQGKLPNLKKLLDSSAHGGIRNEDLFYLSPIVWTSISTGTEQRVHGIKDFVKYVDGKRTPYSSLDVKVPTIWEILGQHSKRSYVLGWMMTRYSEVKNAQILSDHLVRVCEAKPEDLYPEGFNIDKALEVCGKKHTIDDIREIIDISQEEYDSYKRPERQKVNGYLTLVRRDSFYTTAALDILESKRGFDLLALYLREPDSIGHIVTRYRDSSEPVKSEQFIEKIEATFESGYEYSDRAVGELLKHVTEDDYVIVISDHGFGDSAIAGEGTIKPGPFFKHKLMLELLGFLTFANACGYMLDQEKTLLYWDGMKYPKEYKNLLSFDGYEEYAPVPGREAEIIGDFVEAAAEVKTPDGTMLFSNIDELRKEKPWEQGNMTVMKFNDIKANDILWVNKRYHNVSQFMRTRPAALYHRGPGVFMVKGPGIKQGELSREAGYYDVAPTILYMLGLPVPNNMDGKVMSWIFEPKHFAKRKVVIGPAAKKKPSSQIAIPNKSKNDQKHLQELRSLGYIE